MLSNKPPSGYCITLSQQLAAVSSAPFSTPDLLGTTGSSLSLHSDILITISHKLQPTLLIVTSRTLGLLALSVIVSPFLGRGNSSLPIYLGLCKGTSMKSPLPLESMNQWDMQTVKHFRAYVSAHMQFGGCVATGMQPMTKGKQTNKQKTQVSFPLRKGAGLTLMPSEVETLGFLFVYSTPPPPIFFVCERCIFFLTKYEKQTSVHKKK